MDCLDTARSANNILDEDDGDTPNNQLFALTDILLR